MKTTDKTGLSHSAAVFLDRDGTIIEDMGHLKNPDSIRLIPGAIDALKKLSSRYSLFVVSNQVGVARGEIDMREVERVNGALESLLEAEGIRIKQWYICPHEESDNCGCRKPSPFFLEKASRTYKIDLGTSFMIGDHPTDPQTADAAGAFGLYVLTGHGMRHLEELPEHVPVFHHIGEASDWILAHPNPTRYLETAVEETAEAVRNGELAVFPTETVYGLGADALNPEAVARIFEAKQRPLHDPLIVHVSNLTQLKAAVTHLSKTARTLIEAFWPGPLTLVLPKSRQIPDIVTAGKENVAVRMPAAPLARAFISAAGTPVAAPSANLFGRTSPTTAAHVRAQLEGTYEAIIDAGTCRVGVESTVLALTSKRTGASEEFPRLLRAGGLSVEEIETLIGPVIRDTSDEDSADYLAKQATLENSRERDPGEMSPGEAGVHTQESPGLLSDHYAPRTPLKLVETAALYKDAADVGKLLFSGDDTSYKGPVVVLSPAGDPREAAVRLYHAIQHLDTTGVRLLVAERAPDYGLGHAINDRLAKASQKNKQ